MPARRRAKKRRRPGFLNVGARPAARIFIDGQLWPAQTPQAGIELRPGPHVIELQDLETGRRVRRKVTIASGGYRTLMVDLRGLP